MEILIWIGAAVALAGLAGIIASMVLVARAKAARLGDEALRQRLKSLVPLNMIALLVSAIGLMCVVVGILLG
jgi:hypothetical protein